MTRHVAFLRGINLGKRRVKRDRLRSCFEELGLENVSTFIASGNVVFDHAGAGLRELQEELEIHLESALGFFTETFVRPMGHLEQLANIQAIGPLEEDGFFPHVIFLQEEVDPPVVDGLKSLETSDDRFLPLTDEVIWFRRGGLSETPIKTHELERALGRRKNTTRNLQTIRRILEKFGPSPGGRE